MIKVKGLSVSYGNKKVIDNFNFELSEGEIVALTGKNGSGKSTFCMALLDLLDKDIVNIKGEILLFDKPLGTISRAEKSKYIGIIFQEPDYQLFSPNVEAELAFAPENLCLPREAIEERIQWALSVCGIEHLRNRNTNSLSGGEKQLVAIASTLTMRPKILVADEITAQIDSENSAKIREILVNHAKGGAVIIVTHSEDDLKICSREQALRSNV